MNFIDIIDSGKQVATIEAWYDRLSCSWIVQSKDADGNQIGSSDILGSKHDAIHAAAVRYNANPTARIIGTPIRVREIFNVASQLHVSGYATAEHFSARALVDAIEIITNNLELARRAGVVLEGDLSVRNIQDAGRAVTNVELRDFLRGLYWTAFFRELDEATAELALINQPKPITHSELHVGRGARLTLWETGATIAEDRHLATVYSYNGRQDIL